MVPSTVTQLGLFGFLGGVVGFVAGVYWRALCTCDADPEKWAFVFGVAAALVTGIWPYISGFFEKK